MELGFFLGVDGPLTYPKADALRVLMKEIPLDRIVLETDSPYLPPQSHRGQRNDPSFLPEIAETLAHLKGVPVSTIAEVTTANARRLYGLP
jgi:TatD DNase family protein